MDFLVFAGFDGVLFEDEIGTKFLAEIVHAAVKFEGDKRGSSKPKKGNNGVFWLVFGTGNENL